MKQTGRNNLRDLYNPNRKLKRKSKNAEAHERIRLTEEATKQEERKEKDAEAHEIVWLMCEATKYKECGGKNEEMYKKCKADKET